MRILPFFIVLSAIASCSLKNNKDKKIVAPVVDSIIPAMDTAIISMPAYDPISDSIYLKHKRDSFYAVKPAYLFTSKEKSAGFDKLIAAAIDTNAVLSSAANFKSVETYRYDRNSIPISKTFTHTNNNYKIQVITTDLEVYKRKKILINGKPLRWGKDIDTSLTGGYISYYIELNQQDFRLIKFGQKEFLYMSGYIEKCNGNGCGVSYHLLYDPEINKAVAMQQYRIKEFYTGKCGTHNQLDFLVLADYDHNYLYNYFPVAAKAYSFSPNGKIIPARDIKGKQFYFDGYSVDDPDNISILKANFPFKK
jgi:hypothetical protein